MGFFSFKCSVCKQSIPAFPWAGCPEKYSEVVMVLPDNTTIRGTYDGYGKIGRHDIYEVLAPHYFHTPKAVRGMVFRDLKYLTSPDGAEFEIHQFRWDHPLPEFDNKSLNQLSTEGWKIDTDFNRIQPMIRIVRRDHYTGQKYEDLQPCEPCEYQGYFYPENYQPS